jgi:GH15 family glucan-1,4-alpha-glucosidase
VSRDSRVWFTLSHGILNEVYYPRIDHACTRDLGFIVTDGQAYFSEEKRDTFALPSPIARMRHRRASASSRSRTGLPTKPPDQRL